MYTQAQTATDVVLKNKDYKAPGSSCKVLQVIIRINLHDIFHKLSDLHGRCSMEHRQQPFLIISHF